MEKRIDDILEELYLIEPSLRDEEAALKKTIRDLLESRPDARMDEEFAAELKEKLLAEFAKKARPNVRKGRFIFARPAYRIGLGIAAAAALIIGIYVGLGPKAGVPRPATGDGRSVALSAGKPAADDGFRAAVAVAPGAAQPSTVEKGELLPLSDYASPPPAAAKDEELRLSSDYAASSSGSPAAAAAPLGRAAPSVDKSAQSPKKASTEAQAELAPDAIASGRFNPDFNTEGYDRIVESSFAKVLEEPLSTFSIDVDTASYSNVRRFLRSGTLPPPDAVRIEELVNYFPYDYAGPVAAEGPTGAEGQTPQAQSAAAKAQAPFAFDSELSACPWNASHSLLRVALQAKRIADADIPPSNLVFLIDVSGSMDEDGKLPLVKESLKLLARRMRQQDKISIVVYAGNAGLVLAPTPGSRKDKILAAIDNLEAGGSTAGGEGIQLAYETAKKAFIPKGSNRIILATDGDFNVGPSSDGELVRIIEEERKAGVFLTVLGFGMGNYQDSKMQKLADSGNGNYAYIDSLAEADKVLAKQMTGTIFTVAKDVKIQIEFNPMRVGEYRLIGYEKRALAARDFADDAKDAGELGAGSSVTALYELTPPSGQAARTDLKYQSQAVTEAGADAAELMTIKFRYKNPDVEANDPDQKSILIEQPVAIETVDLAKCSDDFRFAAAVTEWGLVLRQSAYKGGATLEQAASIARGALGRDQGGYRAEFLDLVRASQKLTR